MHPVIEASADGRLPTWAEATPGRVAHMVRVAEVMDVWGAQLGLGAWERRRWRAAAMLHDALRDADPETLRSRVPDALKDLPGGMLHGPAAAERLAGDGVDDEPLLLAVRWHTTGHPEFDRLGRALYLADFAEPGRSGDADQLATLRSRVPGAMDVVLVEVAAERIGRTLAGAHRLRHQTVDFWNSLVNHA